MENVCFTVRQCAELLHCNPKKVRHLIRSGRLQAIALSPPPRTEYRVLASSLARLLQAEPSPAVSRPGAISPQPKPPLTDEEFLEIIRAADTCCKAE